MKCVLLQSQGITQLVLTPETPWEEAAVKAIPDKEFVVKRGSFYAECLGGYMREYSDNSSIIFISKVEDTTK